MSTEKQYIAGFNNGYILAQYEPDLLNTVSKTLTPSNNYLHSFFAGKQQFELENYNEQLEELTLIRALSLGKGKDHERDE